jgi:ABC-type transport system substrate-binding protein
VAEAIDRKALIQVALGGLGKPAYSPVPAASPFYDKAAKGYAASYSPSRARRVLAAYHVTGPYTLVTYTIPVFATTAEFIQAQLAQVGVSVKLAIKPVQDAQTDMKGGAFDMQVNIWNSDDLYPYLDSRGDTNTTFYRDATLDRLLTQTRETLNSKKAVTAFKDLQHYVAKTTVVVPLFSRVIVMAGTSRLKDWHGSTLSTTPYPVLQDLHVTS